MGGYVIDDISTKHYTSILKEGLDTTGLDLGFDATVLVIMDNGSSYQSALYLCDSHLHQVFGLSFEQTLS